MNYPDDIHNYDDHPQSPFYEQPWTQCEVCEAWFDEEDIDEESPTMCVSCADVDREGK